MKEGINYYYVMWRARRYKENTKKMTCIFEDGTEISAETFPRMEYDEEVAYKKAYWRSLPFWKRWFKSEPNYL